MNNFSSHPIEVGLGDSEWFLVLVKAVDLDLVFADEYGSRPIEEGAGRLGWL